MSAAKDLFRKEALDRLQAPEQLDRAITVAPARSWMWLLAVGLLLAAALAWALFGTVATRIPARGILVAIGGQVTDATAAAAGVMVPAGVQAGEAVQAGQPIARIISPEAERRAADGRLAASELAAEAERRAAAHARATAARAASEAVRRSAISAQIQAAEERMAAVGVMLRGQLQLARSGNTTEDRVQALQERLAAARQQVAEARAQLAALEAEELALAQAAERDLAELAQRAADARRSAEQLALVLEQDSVVRAPVDGRLLEWKAAFGARIAPGTPVASIESGATGLEATLFLAPDKGKQVVPGMDVRVEPAGFRKEEWGTLVGRVVAVSDFPVTRQGMLAVLQNDRLVDQFARDGAPFALRVRLEPQAGSPTGYRWSGGQGPAAGLSSGMPAEAQVAVREQPPIALVLPFLRRVTGLH